MTNYLVTIKEIVTHKIIVTADNEETAKEQAYAIYFDGDVGVTDPPEYDEMLVEETTHAQL